MRTWPTPFPNSRPTERLELARRMWEHLFLLVLEVAHVPRKVHETNWRKYITLRGVAPLMRQLLSDRPVIVVTGHFGNFELGGYALGILGFPTFTVARNLDNAYLDRYLASFRAATGQHLIPKNGGYDQIEHVLDGGGTMAFLADQYAGEKGCWVDFFGRPASAHKAISLLALEHDAPVAVCYARRLGAADAIRNGYQSHGRSSRRPRRRRHGPRHDPVVHEPVGAIDPHRAGAILVGPSPLEGHAKEAGKPKSRVGGWAVGSGWWAVGSG